MRAFTDLTERGQLNRLRRFAVQVVAEHYGMPDADVHLVSAHSFNTVFRVSAGDDRFALRLASDRRIHVDGTEAVEAAWLRLLHDDGFTVPTTIRSTAGTDSVGATHPSIPGRRTCSMFTWVKGRPLVDRLTADSMTATGSLLAKLHDHASSHRPPQSLPSGLHADRVVYFPEENLIASYRSSHGELFSEAVDRSQGELDDLWRSPPHRPHLLHGDFGPRNVLSYRNRLAPIDFQDLQYGFDLQDVALSLADMRRNAPELIPAFRNGYRAVRPWPDLSPKAEDTFAAARSLNIMNLGIHHGRSGIGRFLDEHARLVADWMDGVSPR